MLTLVRKKLERSLELVKERELELVASRAEVKRLKVARLDDLVKVQSYKLKAQERQERIVRDGCRWGRVDRSIPAVVGLGLTGAFSLACEARDGRGRFLESTFSGGLGWGLVCGRTG